MVCTELQLVREVHPVAWHDELMSNRQLKASQLTMLNVPCDGKIDSAVYAEAATSGVGY